MKVCFVRHRETAWSLSGQHTGMTDLGLTAHGEDESRALALRLRTLAFKQVLVSPRLRARQTCELAGFGAASKIEPDLSEWDYGITRIDAPSSCGMRVEPRHRAQRQLNDRATGLPYRKSKDLP